MEFHTTMLRSALGRRTGQLLQDVVEADRPFGGNLAPAESADGKPTAKDAFETLFPCSRRMFKPSHETPRAPSVGPVRLGTRCAIRDSLRAMEPIDFDDIDAINAVASEDFGSWGRKVLIPQDLVDAYADLVDDHQWIHVDVERCRAESPFGAPIAHGFLVLSLMHQSIPRPVEVKGHKSAINYGAENLRFLAPVIVGSTIRARSRVVRAEATPKGTLITAQVEVGIVGQEKPALLYGMQVLYI